MKSHEIRQTFIDYFGGKDHRPIASSPLVPQGDATLMFTNAGMVQFKDYFLGLDKPPHPRAVTAQKCLRVSGKHNDLENVGPSPRHHTFFEMLGNFSFGDYFKEDAIKFGWELVTEGYGLNPKHLFASVFEEDDEAAELWHKITGLPRERIIRCGAKDNFWQMGDTGPCGPCSEIFVDRHPELPEVSWEEGDRTSRYLEIWNLVFMQFERSEDGKMTPLPNPSIDTGAGLERIAAVLQKTESNYETDLFVPIMEAAAGKAGTSIDKDRETNVSLRVIADHLRSVSFLLADGVIPGPSDRGYVLRRLLRRAVRHGMRIGFEEPFLYDLVPVLGQVMGEHYEELGKTEKATRDTIQAEEEKYLSTLAVGARRVQEAIDRTRDAGDSVLSGPEVFKLYETYGLEVATVQEIAEEEQIKVDVGGFEKALAESQEKAREGTRDKQKRMASLRDALAGSGDEAATGFSGYGDHRLEGAKVVRLARLSADGTATAADSLAAGRNGVAVFDRTVFYAESGGQVGDRGKVTWEGGSATVTDTQKDTAGTYFHFLEVNEGTLQADVEVTLQVDDEARVATERHHTATHLLHAALHEVVGENARQAGSLVAPERLRFDFTHGQPLTADEITRIEDIVNNWVRKSVSTDIQERSKEEAMAAGAMALFGEKYGDEVRTVEIPGFSLELCGGCHVRNTGEIGLFMVTGERGTASGVRRIEAITGEVAYDEVRRQQATLQDVASALNVADDRIAIEAAAARDRVKALEKEVADLRRQLVSGGAASDGPIEVDGVKVTAREVPKAPTGELRNLADTLRDKMGSGVVVLASKDGDKVSLIVTVSKDLTKRLKAGNLVKSLAPIVGGGGGGRPDFAQAGGKDPSKLPALLEAVPKVVSEQLGA